MECLNLSWNRLSEVSDRLCLEKQSTHKFHQSNTCVKFIFLILSNIHNWTFEAGTFLLFPKTNVLLFYFLLRLTRPITSKKMKGSFFFFSVLLVIFSLTFRAKATATYSFQVTPAPSTRSALKWPFADYSIWNLPIGKNAIYVPANIRNIDSGTIILPDEDVLIMNSSYPLTPIYYSTGSWNGGNARCDIVNPPKVLATVPFPSDLVLPSSLANYAAAILMQDGQTLVQTQPLCHCTNSTATSNVTSMTNIIKVNLYGDGRLGSHGGSGLSSIGGALRLGELIPDANGTVHPVRHALKADLWAAKNYFRNGSDHASCFRWPATTCDGYFALNSTGQYGGVNPSVRPGSLLALNSNIDIYSMGLKTVPGLALAWTLQNYGVYLVDDTFWNAINIGTEISAEGSYNDQFEKAYGLKFGSRGNQWALDVKLLFSNISVVDNWNMGMWQQVAASNGSMGSGGGTPLMSWAPQFYNGTSNPKTSISPPYRNVSIRNSSMENGELTLQAFGHQIIVFMICFVLIFL